MDEKELNVAEQQNDEVIGTTISEDELKQQKEEEFKRQAFLEDYRALSEKYGFDFVPILMADQQSIRATVVISPLKQINVPQQES